MPFQNKFTSLSLAFKTDKLTLTNRLELQQRQRDIAEKNIDVEIAQLKKEVEVGGPFLSISVVLGRLWCFSLYISPVETFGFDYGFKTDTAMPNGKQGRKEAGKS